MPSKLTPKQKKWLAAYKKHGNATQAAREAGYRAKTNTAFETIGWENLRKLAQEIKDFEKEIESKDIADIEECNRILTEIMRNESTSAPDRIRACEVRLRSAGGFLDKSKIEIDGNIPVTIVDDVDA